MMGGKGDKAKGKANELLGKATGDKPKQMKGKGQQAKGEFKDEFEKENERAKEDPETR
jgi:uncharacterized protein YjbJ (UPF0337 family)